MPIIWYAGLVLCMLSVAFVAAILGIGGGSLYTPIQLFFGVGIHEAATTGLFLSIILSIGATGVYRRAGKVDWQLAICMGAFALGGAFIGGYISEFMPARMLVILLIVVVAFAGVSMFRRGNTSRFRIQGQLARYHWRRVWDGESYAVNVPVALSLSFFTCGVSAMVGVGGGIFMVPIMAIVLGLPIDIAIATSAFMVGITSVGGFSGHFLAGHWDWKLSLILSPGVLVGAGLGARFMLGLEKAHLKKIFGIFMFLIAAGMILKMIFS